LDALVDSDMRLRIKQARPANLDEAIRHSIELEAFNKAEQKHRENKGYIRPVSNTDSKESEAKLDSLISRMDTMQRAIEQMQADKRSSKTGYVENARTYQQQSATPNRKPDIQCFNCGRKGHFMKECRAQKDNRNANSRGSGSQKSHSLHSDGRSGLNTQSGDVGLFVTSEINGLEVKFLVDTGATVSHFVTASI